MTQKIIFKALVGSRAYGTQLPTSDTDYKGIYVQNSKDLLSINNYMELLTINKDECYYEIKKFIELLNVANPTILELLWSPEDCIISKDPIFDLILEHKQMFLTKQCAKSFGGYAAAQIKKATGLDKKQNWEMDKVIRKEPLDFAYTILNGKTLPIKVYLNELGLLQENCGLAKLNHAKDCYALYYDKDKNIGYKGIVGENSNELRLSNIPKNENMLVSIYYNIEGYSSHCKDYKEYKEWLEKRNITRYVDVKNHGQKIDGKNLMHCIRLLEMAEEIAEQGVLNVRRPNPEYLISIRKGAYNLKELVNIANSKVEKLDDLYKKSSLADKVNEDFLNDLLYEIRKRTIVF